MLPPRLAAIIALAALFSGCGSRATGSAVDPGVASLLLPDARVLGGLHLAQLRAAPLYSKLPPAVLSFVGPLNHASDLVFAFNGTDLLTIARGAFPEPPPGATLLAPDLAVAGSPEAVRAAAVRHREGGAGAPALLARAGSLASANQVWLVAQGGGTPLPLSGNWDNLNRVLQATEYLSLTAKVDSRIEIEAAGVCPSADGARRLEESVRAILTLAGAGVHDAELAALLGSVRLSREDRVVRAAFAATADASQTLLRQLSR